MMRIVFSIIIIIIAGAIAWYSFSNLQQAEEGKEISKTEIISYRYEKPFEELDKIDREIRREDAVLIRGCIRTVTEYHELNKQLEDGEIEMNEYVSRVFEAVRICDADVANIEEMCDFDGVCIRSVIEDYYDAR